MKLSSEVLVVESSLVKSDRLGWGLDLLVDEIPISITFMVGQSSNWRYRVWLRDGIETHENKMAKRIVIVGYIISKVWLVTTEDLSYQISDLLSDLDVLTVIYLIEEIFGALNDAQYDYREAVNTKLKDARTKYKDYGNWVRNYGVKIIKSDFETILGDTLASISK